MSNQEEILKLFEEDKLLVRAMDAPSIDENSRSEIYHNFTTWATEVDSSLNAGLDSVSSTLLVSGEKIPTYKNLGFIINSEKANILHIADSDSGSIGRSVDGTFQANSTSISSLDELADKIRQEKSTTMNEVNINIKNDSIVGLFVNKASSDFPKAQILMAQEYYELHTGKELPIFIYDPQKGKLESLEMSESQKKEFLKALKPELMTLNIGYFRRSLANNRRAPFIQKNLEDRTNGQGGLSDRLSSLSITPVEEIQNETSLPVSQKKVLTATTLVTNSTDSQKNALKRILSPDTPDR